MTPYLALFGVLVALACLEQQSPRLRRPALLVAGGALVAFAGFRAPEVDRDFTGYISLFEAAVEAGRAGQSLSELFDKDPAFPLIARIVDACVGDEPRVFFFVFAILGVGLKLTAIARLSRAALLSTVVYFGGVFLYHEMTQIRVGVACGLLLLSIVAIARRRPVLFVAIVLCAAAFHYSALVFLPMYLLDPRRLDWRVWTVLLVVPVFFRLVGISFLQGFSMLGDNVVMQRFFIYLYLQEEGIAALAKPFNIVIVAGMAVGACGIARWRVLARRNPYAVVLVKVQVWSVAIFYMFHDLGAVAFRFMELLGVVQIVLVPALALLYRPRWAATLGTVVWAGFWLWTNLFRTELLGPYVR